MLNDLPETLLSAVSLEYTDLCETRNRALEIRVLSVTDTSSPTLPVALRPNAGHGLLILEISRSHATTHHSR